VWGYLARMGVSVRGPGHEALQEGDRLAGLTQPIILRLEDIEELLHTDYKQFSCQVPGCGQKFSQLHESETHYNATHRHSCSTCRKSLPSPHLLELHIQECHDSFFAVLSERKASYQCFLPTCQTLFWGPKERHDHVIKVHQFPPDFRFDAVKRKERKKKQSEPSNKAQEKKSHSAQPTTRRPKSLVRVSSPSQANKRSSLICLPSSQSPSDSSLSQELGQTAWASALDVSKPETSPVSLTGSLKKSRIPVLRSSSCRIPANPSFGAGVQRTFVRPKTKHWHQNGEPMDTTINIEKMELNTLKNALPD